jgi:hypothetical protein
MRKLPACISSFFCSLADTGLRSGIERPFGFLELPFLRVSELSKRGVGAKCMGIPALWYWRAAGVEAGSLKKDLLELVYCYIWIWAGTLVSQH